MGQAALIVLLVVGGSVLYGVLHDQITIRICLEYFTVFHPRVVDTEDPTLLALVWGILATWWAGLLIGVPLAIAARAGRGPKRSAAEMRRPLGELLLLAAVTAAVGGIAGRIAAHLGWVWIHADWVGRIPEAEHVDFLTVLWIHNGSYHGGLVGGVLLAVRTWRRRKRGEGRA